VFLSIRLLLPAGIGCRIAQLTWQSDRAAMLQGCKWDTRYLAALSLAAFVVVCCLTFRLEFVEILRSRVSPLAFSDRRAPVAAPQFQRRSKTTVRKAQGYYLSAKFWHAAYLMDLFQMKPEQMIAPVDHIWTDCGTDVDLLVAWTGMPASFLHSGRNCHTNASILHLVGDERCNKPELFEAFPRFRLVIREFACFEQYADLYKRHPNVHIIPLAYGTGMFGCVPLIRNPGYQPLCSAGLSSLQVVAEIQHEVRFGKYRKYAWSFMGTIKEDRQLALDAFQSLVPQYVRIERGNIFGRDHILNNHSNLVQMGETLRESYFAIGGRGWINLDCHRWYESTVNGAIPVVVGRQGELQGTFGAFGSRPPWIFAETWLQARAIVEDLLQDPAAVREQQMRLLLWWKGEFMRTREAVGHSLDGHNYSRPENLPHIMYTTMPGTVPAQG